MNIIQALTLMKRLTFTATLSSTVIIFLLLFLATGCNIQPDTEETSSREKEPTEQLGPHPLRFPQLSIRTEKYLLPAGSSAPLDPDWSPDGQWIVFSMRGDIWKVPARGGEAVALTEGSNYYFEPDWSPDGESIAFTSDDGERLGIGVVDKNGENERQLVTGSEVNIEPEWGADGNILYFVSDRDRGLSIFKIALDTEEVTPAVVERGNQIQPAVSPDGESLAYVSPVSGKPGSGGIWIKNISSGEQKLVHFEETRHRAAPRWTPDGQALLYVSEMNGNNDIGIIPRDGGSPIWITHDEGGEMSPAVNPVDGRIAFVSNRAGGGQLFTIPPGGGPTSDWKKVNISSRKPKYATGKLKLRVLNSAGNPVSARIYLEAADGRSYTPDGIFHRVVSVGEQHYFHTDGSETMTLPSGTVRIEAMKGFEYKVDRDSLEIPANGRAQLTLKLEHLVDMSDQGWYSGETHAHDLHGGRFGLSHEDFFKQLEAEDLNVTNALIHRDGTRLMGRWEDLTGKPHPLSTEEHILQYGQEFRGSRGHVGLLGIDNFILPLVGGEGGTAYSDEVLNLRYLEEARAQGGIGGFMHPYWAPVNEPSDGAFSEIPLDVALGKGAFYDVLCIPYDAFENAEMYYRLLNSGFQLSATGGSDNFADVWRDPPAGTDRTYALVEGPLSVDSWLEAVKAGRTFATNGPLISMNVEGKKPGSEISLKGSGPDTLMVRGKVHSIAPLHQIDILLNGQVVDSIDVRKKELPVEFKSRVAIPENGWIAVRAYGPHNRYITDSYPFAQTTPVYVLRNGERYTSPEDARFLRDVVEALWKSVRERDRWHSEADKERYRKAVEKATDVYQRIADGDYSFE